MCTAQHAGSRAEKKIDSTIRPCRFRIRGMIKKIENIPLLVMQGCRDLVVPFLPSEEPILHPHGIAMNVIPGCCWGGCQNPKP